MSKVYLWIAGVFLLAIIVAYAYLVLHYNTVTSGENLGTMGDFVGGMLNPILAFLSFMAILWTIKLQSDTIKLQTKELEATNEELRLTREELSQSRQAQQDSANTLSQQRFEMTFFSLLDILVGHAKEFRSKFSKGSHTNSFTYDYNHRIEDAFFVLKTTYEILVMIDDYKKLDKDMRIYSGILKSCLNVDILHMILGYCYQNDTCDQILKYRNLTTKYDLFEYIIFDNTAYKYFDNTENIFIEDYATIVKTQNI